MIANLIHCMTLVAFGAHVLLGCCSHHQHAEHAVCSHHAEGEPHDLDAIEAQHDHGDFVEADEDEAEHHLPCDHPTQCEEADCKFVSSPVRLTLDVDSGVFFTAFDDCTFAASVSRFLSSEQSPAPTLHILLARHRCALQQSWQI